MTARNVTIGVFATDPEQFFVPTRSLAKGIQLLLSVVEFARYVWVHRIQRVGGFHDAQRNSIAKI